MRPHVLGPPVCGWRLPTISGRLLVVIILALTVSGCVDAERQAGSPDAPGTADLAVTSFFDALGTDPTVIFVTDHGEIRLVVYASLMPQTGGRFVTLVDDGFHDGTIIHRVVDDFVIQGGDPSGTGQLGSGQTIPLEVHPDLHFAHGAMGLARDLDPDSGDSQWFITEKPQPHLHAPSGPTGTVFGAYAMYGQVYAGMDVVQRIAEVTTVPGADRPVTDVTLQDAATGPPADTDLLQLPRIVARHGTPTYTLDTVRPLHLFTDHPFELTVFVAPAEDATAPTDDATTPPETISARLQQGDHTATYTLHPNASDPAVYNASIRLPSPADWSLTVTAGPDEATQTLTLHPWHPEYARYDRRP